jgi:hypothetical protein
MVGVSKYYRNNKVLRGLGESNLAWYFIVKGSGIFINVRDHTLLKIKDRDEWPGEKWKGESENDIVELMANISVDTVIFTNSTCKGAYPPLPFLSWTTHERIELFTKLKNSDSTCCPKDIKHTTGWYGDLPMTPELNCRYLNSGKCPGFKSIYVNFANIKRINYIILMITIGFVRECKRVLISRTK